MPRLLRMVAAIGLGSAVLVGAPTALATSSITYAASGIELAATSTQGTFAGTAASNDDAGTWLAVIDHTPLTTTATITGGSFSYVGVRRSFSGAFDSGGTVTLISGATGCKNQKFAVVGSITLTTPAGGSASFVATLTHYRTRIFGSCITYSASINGTVTVVL